MSIDDLKKEWKEVSLELEYNLPTEPGPEVQRFYSSMSNKRLILNNLIEIIYNLVFLIAYWFFLFVVYEPGGHLPLYIIAIAWIAPLISIYPCFLIFKAIHYPDPSVDTIHYIRNLLRLIRLYRFSNTILVFVYCFLFLTLALLTSKGWWLTIDGEKYVSVINYPQPYFTQSLFLILGIAVVFSIICALSGYLMYYLLYFKREKDLKQILDNLNRL